MADLVRTAVSSALHRFRSNPADEVQFHPLQKWVGGWAGRVSVHRLQMQMAQQNSAGILQALLGCVAALPQELVI